jgi:hypothetical protein
MEIINSLGEEGGFGRVTSFIKDKNLNVPELHRVPFHFRNAIPSEAILAIYTGNLSALLRLRSPTG